MNKFKGTMSENHTKNKECLRKLYVDNYVYISSISSSEQPIEDEKIFDYREVSFQFSGTGFRTPERTILFVWIPWEIFRTKGIMVRKECMVVCEDFILRTLSEAVNGLAESLQNDHKDVREKANFAIQSVNQRIVARNGCMYDAKREAFRLRVNFQFPLINGHGINGKSAYKSMKMLLDTICDCLQRMDTDRLRRHINTYQRQQEIRGFMRKENLLAFVADGSILPRKGESEQPMEGAIPFEAPESLRVSIRFENGEELAGMGLKKGITVITGGGYSGKSTLLDCLEQGIYNHIPTDGREYCLVEESACKIYAEDGRYLSNVDISPFFSRLPGGGVEDFSTGCASGSVSQAANIVEAMYGGCKCILIDEDTSATNFMIRDKMMRRLVEREPIIPFTDRVEELKERGISTVLVIGGSGEYLQYGDCILMLEDYRVWDKTEEVKVFLREENIHEECLCGRKDAENKGAGGYMGECDGEIAHKRAHTWMGQRYLPEMKGEKEFYISTLVEIENARYIRIDEYVADITRLTAIKSQEQLNSLTRMVERLFMEQGTEWDDLRRRCEARCKNMMEDEKDTTFGSKAHRYELWLEQVRGIDLLMAVCRLRGVNFLK